VTVFERADDAGQHLALGGLGLVALLAHDLVEVIDLHGSAWTGLRRTDDAGEDDLFVRHVDGTNAPAIASPWTRRRMTPCPSPSTAQAGTCWRHAGSSLADAQRGRPARTSAQSQPDKAAQRHSDAVREPSTSGSERESRNATWTARLSSGFLSRRLGAQLLPRCSRWRTSDCARSRRPCSAQTEEVRALPALNLRSRDAFVICD